MTLRIALPGVMTGVFGLVAGISGLVFDAPLFGVVAGILAAGSSGFAWVVAQRLGEQSAMHGLMEAELRALRAEASRNRDRTDRDDSDDAESLIDRATGLFSEDFFLVALDSRVAAARRHLRPVAMVLIEIVEGLPTGEPRPVEASTIASSVRETLREADTACRLRSGQFALLLEDTPENGAIWTVERIRRALAGQHDGLTVWAGVACYPAHALSSAEMLRAANRALTSARDWRQDRIEVAVAAD